MLWDDYALNRKVAASRASSMPLWALAVAFRLCGRGHGAHPSARVARVEDAASGRARILPLNRNLDINGDPSITISEDLDRSCKPIER